MKQPHKHAELIKQWADGAIIQEKYSFNDWRVFDGYWQQDDAYSYRIKPEPKPDAVDYYCVQRLHLYMTNPNGAHNLKLTFDGETGKLKSAEVMK